MKIGLDLDGVIFDFEKRFLEYLNLPKHGATSWYDERFTKNFHKIENDYDFWLSIPTIFEAKELKFIPEIYVTSRPIPSHVSEKALKAKGFPVKSIVTVGTDGNKAIHLRGKVDFFLDDRYENYVSLNNRGVNTLLVTRNHNKKYNVGENRVDSLIDFQNKYL